MSDPVPTIDKIDAQAQARAKLNEEAEAVMANSRPTPTQRENDLIKEGLLHPDDKEDPGNPTMPPAHEQRKRVADAGATQPYRTRDMGAAQPAGRPAAAQATQAHSTTPSMNPAATGQHSASGRHGAAAAKDDDKK